MYYILDENNNPKKAGNNTISNMGIKDLFRDEFDGHTISTIFLGLDHNLAGKTPVLFETMVFSNSPDYDQYQIRYYTYDEAQKGHTEIYNKIINKESLNRKTFKISFKCGDL